ncbi:solute carrier organic anion transporter family member 74D-like [Macrobrachium rosenbergii]|uniref:solute carrier organic anion transporter family member 74D-like n=1 Tax=Macrobrachium rosenbergii TaxID=79674 RepID=UPI0034D56052
MKKGDLLKNLQQKLDFVDGTKRDSIIPPEKAEEVSGLLHTEDDVEDTKCGIGFFKPKWLQFLARKEIYILVYCLVGITQGMFFTYTVAVLTTIEKRFKLTSKQSGVFLAGNDISQIILSVFLGYYGNYGHRPRWLGVGITIAALSGFAAAFPHFFYGPGQDAVDIAEFSIQSSMRGGANVGNFTSKEKEQEVCYFQPDTCGKEAAGGESYLGPVVIFFLSQFSVGITVSLFYSLGVTYLDDNVNKKVYPIYYAISYMLRVLGPVTGFFVGGKCLSVWIDPSKQPNITRRDPRWYGAWWIGYLFIGCNLLFCGLLMLLFPKKLPATLKRETKKVIRQARKDEKEGSSRGVHYFVSLAKNKKEEHEKPTLQNLRKALVRLFTNRIWVATIFNTVVAAFAGASYWYFKPKYLESQFRKSASDSSYYTGLVALVSMIFGTGIGGVVMRWIHPGPRFVAGYNIFITCVTTTSYVLKMFVGCPKLNVIGPIDGSEAPPCSAGCGCSDRFTPMCSQDGSTLFYSPCYAGCTVANTTASPIVYSNCLCISNATDPLNQVFPQGDSTGTDSQFSFGYGISGYCEEPCNQFFYFIIIETVVRIIEATARVGNSLIYMRCTSDEDKSVSLALMTVFLSVFSFIPAPIVMGAIVDSVCLVWDKTCGTYGNCWLYDSEKLRYIIHLVPAALVLVSILGDIVVYIYSENLDLYGARENILDVGKNPTEPPEKVPLNKVELEKREETLNGTDQNLK